MVMGRRDILETVLFDSELIVTVGYLSRHADIPIDDAKELVFDVVGNKDKANVHAVYLLSGEMNDERCEGDQRCNKPAQCRRVQLVREKNLDAIRHKYRTVDTCEIFCLHSKPIKL
uniref:DNA polymerase delta subunit 3 n=1 Tax=Parascaris equorum TaxID=6256 RepID=A0A914SC62_PAREQ